VKLAGGLHSFQAIVSLPNRQQPVRTDPSRQPSPFATAPGAA